jgi:hypothetical protein
LLESPDDEECWDGSDEISACRELVASNLAALQGVIDRVREALLMLKGWDMLSLLPDGKGAVTDDAPWAQKLIADTLALLPLTGGEL